MATSNRIFYLDLLRIIAIIAVIFIHVSAIYWYADVNTTKWLITNSWNATVRWGVPVFVMISGAVFLNFKSNISVKDMFCKYILRLIICLLIWGIIYYLYDSGDYTLNGIVNGLKGLVMGKAYSHLWFLYMMIGLYLITPILKNFVTNASKSLIEYFLVLWLIIGIFCPFIATYLFVNINSLLDQLSISLFTGFIGYYIAGYYLSKYELSSKARKILYVLSSLLFVTSIFIGNYLSIKRGIPIVYNNSFNPNTVILAMAIFSLLKDVNKKLHLNEKTLNVIVNISKLTFGIYLVHFLVLKILLHFGIGPNIFNNLFSIPFISIIIFFISLIISYIISKIPILKKIII